MESDALMGEIKLFAGSFAPVNWELCQGQVQQIQTNTALFSIIGTQFGGDGVTTFNLPNLAPLAAAGEGAASVNYIICVNGIYPQRP
jgi:microcystin-dependent protein